ncbi:MAG: hypothetical protein HKN49_03870 [Gammaproteobacteria bacterium]|nr:hypothetical protein [Gammaproteobacteria bacterium]
MTDSYKTDKSHPLGTGVGALSGGAAAGALGTALGGPVGGVIGAVIGAFAGGAAGHEIAEELDPTDEDNYWRKNYTTRPYVKNAAYTTYRPAYAYGWTSRRAYLDRDFDEMENELRDGWNSFEDKVELRWDQARDAVKDGWDRVGDSFERMFHDEDEYWDEYYRTRPYVDKDSSFDTYRPAYRFGYRNRLSRWGEKFDDIENELRRDWERFEDRAGLTWARAREAVRDGWHHLERRLPGDADGDGR